MCLPCPIALKAWRMPAAGTPVASTITSISGQAISASVSSVTCVLPRASAFPSEGADIDSSFQPAVRSWGRARDTSRSASATRCIPSVKRTWEANMVPNFPAPMRPMVTGRPAACRSSSMAWRFTECSDRRKEWSYYGRPTASCLAQVHTCALQTRCTVALLAHRARHENLGRTFRIVRRAALEQDLRRTFVLRLGVDAFAGLKSLAAAGRGRRRLAVGGAVLRRGATLADGHDARVRQSHDRVGRILGDVAGLLGELIERRLRALQIRLEPGRALVEPMADRIDEARPGRGIRRRRRGRIGSGLARLLARNIAGGPQLLRERRRGQAKRARGHDSARDGRESASLNYFRMAG